MTSRQEHLYAAIFRKIIDIMPSSGIRVTEIMCDFEAAMRSAIIRCFPNISLSGCNFHYSQAILRKISILGLTRTYKQDEILRNFIRKLLVSRLMPSNCIREAPEIIRNELPTNCEGFF